MPFTVYIIEIIVSYKIEKKQIRNGVKIAIRSIRCRGILQSQWSKLTDSTSHKAEENVNVTDEIILYKKLQPGTPSPNRQHKPPHPTGKSL